MYICICICIYIYYIILYIYSINVYAYITYNARKYSTTKKLYVCERFRLCFYPLYR